MTKKDRIALRYHDTTLFRAAIQALPYGGPLDTLLAWRGSKLQQERLDRWLREMEKSLGALDSATVQYSDFETEEGADLLMAAMRAAARHRSHRRIKALAIIVVKRAQGFEDWNEAEEAVKLIDDLQELDLLILLQMSSFQISSGVFEDTITFQVGDIPIKPKEDSEGSDEPPKALTQVFPDTESQRLRLATMRLVGLGLVADEGVNRFNTKKGHYFSFTEAAIWLLAWIANEEPLRP